MARPRPALGGLRDERGLGLDWNAPKLAKSAKKHAGVESDNVDDLDRMWPQVISPLKAEVENRKTPDLVMVGGLKDNRLVGVEGLEPPTLSV